MFTIEVIFPNKKIGRFFSRERSLLIGKSGECKLRLNGWLVGAKHAEIFVVHEQTFVRDLGSFSSTLVNGKKILSSSVLYPDDKLTVANHEISVKWSQQSKMRPKNSQPIAAHDCNQSSTVRKSLTSQQDLNLEAANAPP